MRNVSARCLGIALACALSAADGVAQTPVTFQYFYDEIGQLTRVVDSTGVVLEYVYDSTGNNLEIKRLTVAVGQLTILGLTPSQGRIGAAVEIQGQGFATGPSGNIVRFNGTLAKVVSAASNRLSVLVPAGASTGPVSVLVGSGTALSPNPFTVLAFPLITSIAPRALDVSRPPASILVTGSNLTGSSFALSPAFAPPPVVLGTPQIDLTGTLATLPVTVASNARGIFVLVATNTLGISDAFPNQGNTLVVVSPEDDVDSDGDGFPDGLELLLGSDPFDAASVPDLRTNGDLFGAAVSLVNLAPPSTSDHLLSNAFSVMNAFLPSEVPQVLVSGAFSVANTVPTQSGSQDLLSAMFSVSNMLLGATAQEVISPAVSLLNVNPFGPPSQQPLITLPQGGVTNSLIADALALSVFIDEPADGQMLVEGQTITVATSVFGNDGNAEVTFTVNGVTFSTDSLPPYAMIFTVPSGVPALTFAASVRDLTGNSGTAATPVTVSAERDPSTSVTGRVVDSAGNTVRGAVVELFSEGLEAEFFDFATPLSGLPDLSSVTPTRTTRVTAINMRGPDGIFSFDPFGLAARGTSRRR